MSIIQIPSTLWLLCFFPSNHVFSKKEKNKKRKKQIKKKQTNKWRKKTKHPQPLQEKKRREQKIFSWQARLKTQICLPIVICQHGTIFVEPASVFTISAFWTTANDHRIGTGDLWTLNTSACYWTTSTLTGLTCISGILPLITMTKNDITKLTIWGIRDKERQPYSWTA